MSGPGGAQAAVVGLNLGGKIFFGSLCVSTFGLGCWQSQRLLEKQELMKQRAAELLADPLEWTEAIIIAATAQAADDSSKNNTFRRYAIQGRFLHDRECLVGPRGAPPGALGDGIGSGQGGMSSSPQGYFVLTPLLLNNDNNINKEEEKLVLINRGWVPRHMVVDKNERPQRQQKSSGNPQQQEKQRQQQQRIAAAANNSSSSEPLLAWDRPDGPQTVVVVPSKTEQPKFLIAGHDLEKRPPRLFWYDSIALQALLGMPILKDKTTFRYWTCVQPPSQAKTTNVNKITSMGGQMRQPDPLSKVPSWPVQPTADRVGDFKISPEVHAAYAFTWFSLSAAGVYMTRKLITRGRA